MDLPANPLDVPLAQNVGSELIGPLPVEEEKESMGKDDIHAGMTALQQMDTANEVKQLRTELLGIDGNGGMLALIREIRDDQKTMTAMYHEMDKRQDLLEAKNDDEHGKLKSDVDGIGRKAQRAIEIAENADKKIDQHITDELEGEVDALEKKAAGSRDFMKKIAEKLIPEAIRGLLFLAMVGVVYLLFKNTGSVPVIGG